MTTQAPQHDGEQSVAKLNCDVRDCSRYRDYLSKVNSRDAAALAPLAAFALACAATDPHPPRLAPPAPTSTLVRTASERSHYTQVDRYDDVIGYLRAVEHRTPQDGPLDLWSPGYSAFRRLIPYAVVAQPMVRSTAAAHRLGRPVVLVRAAAHGTDADGTDAVLQAIRQLTMTADSTLLDSVVIVAIPMANPDGADNIGPVSVNAPDLSSPIFVGTQTTINGADLNHDLVLATEPETRAFLSTLVAWLPDVFLDVATGDDTIHAVTIVAGAPPAAVFTGRYASDTFGPALEQRLQDGGWNVMRAEPSDTDMSCAINYFAVRGRVALRATTNPHLQFADRIAALAAVIRQTVALAAEQRNALMALTATADTTAEAWGAEPDSAPAIPVSGRVTRRLASAYVLSPDDSTTAEWLTRHGIMVGPLRVAQHARIVERFVTDTTRGDHWLRSIGDTTLAAGSYYVSMAQRQAILAMVLLEPHAHQAIRVVY
jgi:Zinc carboxypeptidase